jgi:ElaB/YqjD/DUF883 family membrane-anchored ribosome-binding protein
MSTVNPNDDARIRRNREDAEIAFTQNDVGTARDDATGARSPEEIEAEISRTRAQMDGTLSQLQRRLGEKPNEVADQFVHNLTEAVIRNPVPALLVATGAVWVMGSTLWRHRVPVALAGSAYAWHRVYGPEEGRYYRPEPYDEAEQDGSGNGRMRRIGGKISSTSHQARDSITGAAASGRERLSSGSHRAVDSVRNAAASGRDRLSATGQRISETSTQLRDQVADAVGQVADAVGNARNQVSHLSESARYRARRATYGTQRMAREQPFVTAALGLAAGALVAALLPRTRREDELVGESRDRLMERAREEVHEQVERGKEVAEAAGEAATEASKEEAKRQQKGDSAKTGPSSTDRPRPGM